MDRTVLSIVIALSLMAATGCSDDSANDAQSNAPSGSEVANSNEHVASADHDHGHDHGADDHDHDHGDTDHAASHDEGDHDHEHPGAADNAPGSAYVLDYTMQRLNGETTSLSEYEGNVVMMVNVASECGLTPQYEQLEAVYEEYADAGLVILGFPANNFGAQEPGTNEEIAHFCEVNFGVKFPMFAKISVKGEDQHPLYQQLTTMPEPVGGDVQWNFQKYLVDRSGEVVAKFGPRTKPDDPVVIARINELLEEG